MPLTITTPVEEGLEGEPEETGATFAENALLKARHYASATGILLTLADDSGLEVDGLNGEPGVHSARYAGAGASDADRVRLLLSKLVDVPDRLRTARFVCVVALVFGGGREETFCGSREGFITREPRGRNGFGYDPVFYLPEMGKTFAQLEPEAKNGLSHRTEAAHKAVLSLTEDIKAAQAS